jgi:catechol 2,3-dioxygenase-like lactoylglutathione lyase family enzyme
MKPKNGLILKIKRPAMESYLEHVNISVRDVDKTVKFLITALPGFRVRNDSRRPKRCVHLGTDTTYISINQMEDPDSNEFSIQRPGYNHIGFGVENADALRERMLAAGYREGFIPEPHPYRKRVYFIDDDNMQYEFIQYYSEDFAERNDYNI